MPVTLCLGRKPCLRGPWCSPRPGTWISGRVSSAFIASTAPERPRVLLDGLELSLIPRAGSLKVLSSPAWGISGKEADQVGRPPVSAGLASGQAFFGSAVRWSLSPPRLCEGALLFGTTSAAPANNSEM